MRRLTFSIFLAAGLVGCTDAQMASVKAVGSAHHVKCWSGGIVIYEGDATGAVSNEAHSDGYYFEDAATKKLIGVSGNCVITQS